MTCHLDAIVLAKLNLALPALPKHFDALEFRGDDWVDARKVRCGGKGGTGRVGEEGRRRKKEEQG